MKYEIFYHRKLAKDLKNLDKKSLALFFKVINEEISNDPFSGKKLKGIYSDLWRYRFGKFRIIYSIESNLLKILVLRVRSRDKVYDDILF